MFTQKNTRNLSSRRRPGRGAHRGGNFKKMLLIGAIPLVVLGGGAVGLAHYMSIERIDGDFCYARADQPEVAFLIDASMTYQFSDQQNRDLATASARIWNEAAPNSRISILSSDRNSGGSLLSPVGVVCKPPETPEEQRGLDLPSQPAPLLARQAGEARERYERLAERVLADAQSEALAAGDSPILEMYQSVSRGRYFDSPDRDLWVVTDGIQNSEIARFCAVQGDMPPFEIFAEQRRYDAVRPERFTGTDVHFLLVESLSLPQPGLDWCTHQEMRDWHRDYFLGNGADSFELTRLRHGAE